MILLVALVWSLGVSEPQRPAADAAFAHQVFERVASDYAVLAARGWHGEFGGWGCTFAIIGFLDGEPLSAASPTWRTGTLGGEWRAGPLPQVRDTQRDAIFSCADEWGPAVAARMTAAAADPQGWWVRDDVGETASLYSPSTRLAAWVRYGD